MPVAPPLEPMVLVAQGPLPSAREFITSAGFVGAAILVAALLLAAVILYAVGRAAKRGRLLREQQERAVEQARDAEQHNAALQRCWQRLVWVVETAGIEPASSQGASLGLGPELAETLLRGLLRDAEGLGDDTLTDAVTVYLNQFSLVLAQQGGALSRPAHATTDNAAPAMPESTSSTVPTGSSGANATAAPAKKVATQGRRRRADSQ